MFVSCFYHLLKEVCIRKILIAERQSFLPVLYQYTNVLWVHKFTVLSNISSSQPLSGIKFVSKINDQLRETTAGNNCGIQSVSRWSVVNTSTIYLFECVCFKFYNIIKFSKISLLYYYKFYFYFFLFYIIAIKKNFMYEKY